MTRSLRARRALPLLGLAVLLPAVPASANDDLATLRREVERLARDNAEMRRSLEALERDVREAKDRARAAEERAAALGDRPEASGARTAAAGALVSAPVGQGTRVQLLDISLDVLAAVGGSGAPDADLELLQGGDHDPRQRGFTLQQAELSLLGAVDPFFTGEAHLIYFLDPDGESRFEVEEAFGTTQRLPFGLEEHGLQLEAGTFFTEFGRLNPRHPHAWHWQDQPVVLTRFFGEDGMRGPGVRLGWLTPLPWFSELHLGLQNAKGETMVSFLANDAVFGERPIGGRPFGGVRVGSLGDLVTLARWVNGFDLSDSWSGQLGLSGLLGPNATGPDGRTAIYGADFVFKWKPLRTDRGWPFLLVEGEIARRHYHADDFLGCPGAAEPCASPVALDDATLRDWGLYAQLLWGFRRGWAAGLRYGVATGSGSGVAFDAGVGGFAPVSRDADPFRSDRQRVSPLLVWHPSEYSRLRLQYNFDRADFLVRRDEHSLWLGLELALGAHPAHAY